MWTLSGFADEISPDLEEQAQLLDQLGIRWIELRSAWDTNVLDLDEKQLTEVERILGEHGICASPNDVPGYAKEQHMDGRPYAYVDAAGNRWVSGFGLNAGGEDPAGAR